MPNTRKPGPTGDSTTVNAGNNDPYFIPPRIDADGLLAMVRNKRQGILGLSKSINKAEGEFLWGAAHHEKANDAVKLEVQDVVKAARKLALPKLGEWAQNFRAGAVVPDVIDNGPAVVVPPPANNPGAGGVIVNPRPDVLDLSPLFFDGPTTFLGEYRLDPAKLAARYGGLANPDDFGKVTVNLDTGAKFTVRDNQFIVGPGLVGLRLLPVGDGGEGPGFKVMDKHLRETMGLGEFKAGAENYHKNRIYASIVYFHPELYNAKGMKELASNLLATESRQTHEGSYIGEGITTNSPFGYHEHQWDVEGGGLGYPAQVFMESLNGVDQATYNWQGFAYDKGLNLGVVFPPDYKNDIYRTYDVNTALMFFRDWVNKEPYLKNDDTWKTYCAEHKEIVRIVRANLPMNEASYKEVYGAEQGGKLWQAWTKPGGFFEEAHGVAWRNEYETHFDPLYKQDGFTGEQVRPWENIAEYNKYQKARFDGPDALEAYKRAGGKIPLKDGQAMPYRTESTADLIQDFIENYASFQKPEVGGIGGAATVMSFMETCVDRLKLDEDHQGNRDPARGKAAYLGLATPIMQELIYFEAMVQKSEGRVPLAMWLKGAEKALIGAISGGDAQAAQSPEVKGLVASILKKASENLNEIDRGAGLARKDAYKELKLSIADELDAARNVMPGHINAIERNAPPGLIGRTLLRPDHHPVNQHMKISYVCTAVHHDDLKRA